MALDLMKERGVELDKQRFTWREMVSPPVSKLDDDAFTRVRVILMNGIETEALRFGHAAARMNRDLQLPLARVRRVEQHPRDLAAVRRLRARPPARGRRPVREARETRRG